MRHLWTNGADIRTVTKREREMAEDGWDGLTRGEGGGREEPGGEFAKGGWGTGHKAAGAVALLEIDTENSRDRKEKLWRLWLCALEYFPFLLIFSRRLQWSFGLPQIPAFLLNCCFFEHILSWGRAMRWPSSLHLQGVELVPFQGWMRMSRGPSTQKMCLIASGNCFHCCASHFTCGQRLQAKVTNRSKSSSPAQFTYRCIILCLNWGHQPHCFQETISVVS